MTATPAPLVRQDIRTSQGPVPMWTRPVRGGPLVFAVCGALAPPEQFAGLAARLPEADLAIVPLPREGELSVAAFTALYRELLAPIRRPLTLVGASVGGLVCLALSDLGEVVALDPPLSPRRLWPLERFLERGARSGELTPAHLAWYRQVLGCGAPPPATTPAPDFRPLLDNLARRAVVLAGEIPLDPPRDLKAFPSFVPPEDRDLLARHPRIDLRLVPATGHDIVGAAPAAVARVIRATFREAPP